MVLVEVFDPAMCCSTGVCGPSVDPALASFAADLDWLTDQGAQVRRFNLAQEPGMFAERPEVQGALADQGEAALPVVMVDGVLRSAGRYPEREELAGWIGTGPAFVYTPLVGEFVAIGAAVSANCEPCFKYHYDKARKLGATKTDIAAAVSTAQAVKDTPARAMLNLADKLLGTNLAHTSPEAAGSAGDATEPTAGGCCGPTATTDPAAAEPASAGKCC